MKRYLSHPELKKIAMPIIKNAGFGWYEVMSRRRETAFVRHKIILELSRCYLPLAISIAMKMNPHTIKGVIRKESKS